MKVFVGMTDDRWFRFLADRTPDEVNFWRPSAVASFRAIPIGAPFLFKLHSPNNVIAGGGFFLSYSRLPLSLAWEAFGTNNGTATVDDLVHQIRRYRADRSTLPPDPMIGCTILNNPFFWPEADWIPVPSDWKPNIVQGKTYDTDDPIGARLWQQAAERLLRLAPVVPDAQELAEPVRDDDVRYGADYLTRARIGQGAFRVLVTDSYHRSCAITGERTLPVLQAAHIRPFAQSGPHAIKNGLLLRADLHALFDRGYVTIDREYRVEVSARIKEEFGNGREYYALRGQQLVVLPDRLADRPSPEFIAWHNQHVFTP
ncbi:MAG: hypothetical protein NVS2B16_30520 [Chloroflexota bacterium]